MLKEHRVDNKDHRVADIENKLPLEVEHYNLTPNYHLREDYTAALKEEDFPTHAMTHWEEAAKQRPLFLFREEKSTEAPKKHRRFLERLSLPWWRNEDSDSHRQDLYEALDQEQRLSLLGEVGGRWFAYGYFD